MADGITSGARLPNRSDERDGSPSDISRGSTMLYRAPTWARNINFDSPFNLNTQGAPESSGLTSPSDTLTGLALSGSPQLSDSRVLASPSSWGQGEPSTLPHSRNGSSGTIPQGHRSNPHSRQASNVLITPSTSTPTLAASDRSTPRATRPNVSAMLPSHQRVASASSATGSTDWFRSMPPQLHSSADLYAAVDSRPGTSMSTVSASVDESREDRLDSGTSNGIHKRASVLSFQTAQSGMGDYDDGRDSQTFTSAPASEMEVLDRMLPPRPWLTQAGDAAPSGTSSFNSSIDERHLPPGGWTSATTSWNNNADDFMSAKVQSVRNSPPTTSRRRSAERRKSPSMSPRLRLTSLHDPSTPQQSAIHTRSPSGGQSTSLLAQEQKTVLRPTSMLRNDTTEELLSTQTLGLISGPSTFDASLEVMQDATTMQDARQFSGQDKLNQNASLPSSQQIFQHKTDIHHTFAPPAVPEKPMPPSIPPKDEVGLSSPPLSDNIIPTPIPTNAKVDTSSIPGQMPVDRSPVADLRRIPLAAMGKDSNDDDTAGERSTDTVQRADGGRIRVPDARAIVNAAGIAAASAVVAPTAIAPARVGPGVGAHATRNSGVDQTAAPAFAALMRKPSQGSIPRAVVSTAALPAPLDRSPSPSIDTPPREASPPPEGEVEARAEWERAQMRRMADRDKKPSGTPRKTTFRGQLKPLQLMTAEDSKRGGKGSPVQSKGMMLPESPLEEVRNGVGDASGLSTSMTVSRSASGGSAGLNTMVGSTSAGPSPTNGKSGGGGMSTQQLQRQLARDQRRSVSAVNMTMGQMGMGDIGGAYPVFPSPSASPSNVIGGIRQYPGLMPQRSLVPPFELQNRPDGLPSALIGPDGVRRSPNDPEVCLECMMRDEDMIDVHVLGARMWERESDLDFVEAIRLEGEEDAKRDRARQVEAAASNGTDNGTSESAGNKPGEGEGTNGSKEAATVAVGSLSSSFPRLTKIRVKRVAKGEPLTAERLKLHTQMNPPASSHRWRTLQTFLAVQAKYIAMEQKARGIVPPAVPPKSAPVYDNSMIKTQSGDSRNVQRQRVVSPALFQVEEVPLTEEDKANKEKDMVGAREARRRNNAVTASGAIAQGSGDPSTAAEDAAINRLSGPPVVNDNSSGHNSIPRRSTAAGPGAYARAGSIQDLRTLPSAMASKKETLQPISISVNNLAPPQAPFRGGPPSPSTHRGQGTRMRSTSSAMSLANSGSMIDMHVGVGMETSKEHRISQAGFVPGTPIHSQSPGALNRAFYGFPGDGEAEQGENWNQYRGYDQSFGDYDDSYRSSPELERKKKKSTGGLRGFFTKISGKEGSDSRPEDDSMDYRDPKSYMRPDSSMELQPPPGIGGLLSRARRSTSSLLMPSGRQSMDSTMMLDSHRGFSNPLMASQTSLEMGPFGTGPQPPPRKESRLSQIPYPQSPSPPREKEKERSTSRLRAFSSGNLMAKKKTNPNPANRTSSMMQDGMPSPGPNGDYDPYDRSNSASRLSNRRDQPAALGPREGTYVTSPVLRERELFQRQDGQRPRRPSMQDQFRSPFSQRLNRSEIFLPDGSVGDMQSSMADDPNAPRRPPRNPSRDTTNAPPSDHQGEYVDSKSSQPLHIPTSLQKEQYYHSYDTQPPPEAALRLRDRGQDSRQQQQRTSSFGYMSPPTPVQSTTPASTPARKSKLLKFGFGKNKRESTALIGSPRETNSLKSRSSRGTFDEYAVPPANGSSMNTNQAGLDSLRGNAQEGNFPPRSQSAMGGFFPRRK